MEHDQRFKVLLREFFDSFVELFFPDWHSRLDFAGVTWLEQELFRDPPQGEAARLDLVAQAPILPAAAGPRPNEPADLLVLIHVEIESGESVASFRERFYRYYHDLTERHGRAVLPIALFLRVGLQGRGIDCFERRFWERTPLRFEYDYVGLPGLEGADYLDRDNWLAVALSALMRWRQDQRVAAAAAAIERILKCDESDYHKYLLYECVDAYAPLAPEQRIELVSFLKEPEKGAWPMVETMLEKARKQGRQEGQQEGEILGRRWLVRLQLENRFGSLAADTLQRLDQLGGNELDQLAVKLLTANSLQELGLGK